MSKIDCYDKQGELHSKEPIDVRECVEQLGWSLIKPEPKAKKETAAEKKARLIEERKASKKAIDTPDTDS